MGDSLKRLIRAVWLPVILVAMLGVQIAALVVLIEISDKSDYYGCGDREWNACHIRYEAECGATRQDPCYAEIVRRRALLPGELPGLP